MNADTGKMYFDAEQVNAARLRGEDLIPLSRENIDSAIRVERENKLPMKRGAYRRFVRGLKDDSRK